MFCVNAIFLECNTIQVSEGIKTASELKVYVTKPKQDKDRHMYVLLCEFITFQTNLEQAILAFEQGLLGS